MPRCCVDPGLSPILYRTYNQWKGGGLTPLTIVNRLQTEFQLQMATMFHILACQSVHEQNYILGVFLKTAIPS